MARAQEVPLASGTNPGTVIFGDGIPKNNPPGVLSLRAECGVLYVASDGDDVNGDGSQTNPYATLARTWTHIAANPKPLGYAVMLPGCLWEENVPLPPPNTTLWGRGLRSELRAVGGGPITWTEGGTDAGLISFRDLSVSAVITGRNGGNLNLAFYDALVTGSITRVGTLSFDGAYGYPTLTNIAILNIINSRVKNASLAFTYDSTGGTNGLATTKPHLIEGGLWGTIQYTSDDPTYELRVIGAVATQVRALQSAVIRLSATRVRSNLDSVDAASLIEFDMPVQREELSYTGSGRFRLAEIVETDPIGAGIVETNITVCVPRHEAGTRFDRIWISFDKPGFFGSYVSNTDSDVVVHVVPPPGAPAANVFVLIKPRLRCTSITMSVKP